jgi:putative acetyltransferase
MIRELRPDDLEAIARLFHETVRAINCRDYTPAQVAAWAAPEVDADSFRRRLAGTRTVVADDAGQVIGFANLTTDGLIDFLFVHAERQGEGIASRLLGTLEEVATTTSIGELWTNASITARPFFLARGFIEVAAQTVECRGETFRNYRMMKRSE